MVVGDHDELLCRGQAAQQSRETEHVGVVEGGVDLIEDVEGTRVHLLQRQHHGQRGERALSTAEQPQWGEPLAGQLGQDLHPGAPPSDGLEHFLVAVDGQNLFQPQGGAATGEEFGEELLEVV